MVELPETEPHAHVFVVDDEAIMRETLESVLAHAGYRVTALEDGEACLGALEETRPDLVVLDVTMPGLSDIEVMRRMRLEPRTSEIPILFLSAVDDEATVVQGLRGADDYMLKPLKSLEFETRVEKILSKRATTAPGDRSKRLDRLPVKHGEATYLLPLEAIFCLEASGKYTYAHTKSKKHLTGYSISELEESLAGEPRFLRVHRSFIVNLDHVLNITRDTRSRYLITMSDEAKSQVHVSDSYAEALRSRVDI
ncbi:MAG: LytTR family DNA-binding domain-containing protein [Actinomycetota bacterium]